MEYPASLPLEPVIRKGLRLVKPSEGGVIYKLYERLRAIGGSTSEREPGAILKQVQTLLHHLQSLNVAAARASQVCESDTEAQKSLEVLRDFLLKDNLDLELIRLLHWVERDEGGDLQTSPADSELCGICQRAGIHTLAVYCIAPARRQGALLRLRRVEDVEAILNCIGRELVEAWCHANIDTPPAQAPASTAPAMAAQIQEDLIYLCLLLNHFPVAAVDPRRLEPLRWIEIFLESYVCEPYVAELLALLHSQEPVLRSLFETKRLCPFPCALRTSDPRANLPAA